MGKNLKQILVVDVESTCWEGQPPADQQSEIIEIGVCVLDVATLQRQSKHAILVRPEKSQISPFCSRLTSLTSDMFKDAGTLADACRRLKKEFSSKQCVWASWGDYDRRQFERACPAAGVAYPFGISHLNVKSLFALSRGMDHEVGMDRALELLSIPLIGTHHRGIDDAWNIAAILSYILKTARAIDQKNC